MKIELHIPPLVNRSDEFWKPASDQLPRSSFVSDGLPEGETIQRQTDNPSAQKPSDLTDRRAFRVLIAKADLDRCLTGRLHANNVRERKSITGNPSVRKIGLRFLQSNFPGRLIKGASTQTVFDEAQIGVTLATALFYRVFVYIDNLLLMPCV